MTRSLHQGTPTTRARLIAETEIRRVMGMVRAGEFERHRRRPIVGTHGIVTAHQRRGWPMRHDPDRRSRVQQRIVTGRADIMGIPPNWNEGLK